MARKFFGTDGVRGQVGKHPMTVDFSLRLASAAARVLAPEGFRSPTVTCLTVPAGKKGGEVNDAMKARGFTISAGYGSLKDTTIRIGHMGDHDVAELWALQWVDAVLAAAQRDPGRSLRWPQVARLHPAARVASRDPLLAALLPGDLVRLGRAFARVTPWSFLRHDCAVGRWSVEGIEAGAAAWMDDGMFSRWTMQAFPFLEDEVVFGAEAFVDVVEGGFAFRPFLTGMETEKQDNTVFFADEAGTFVASLNGFATANDDSLESLLTLAVQLMNDEMPDAELQAGEPYAITIAGVEGLAADLSGTLFGGPVLGQALVARPTAGHVLNGFALGNTAGGDEVWIDGGRVLFATLLDSIRFFPIAAPTVAAGATAEAGATVAPPAANSPCPIATDASYAFTQANAVRVGGGAFGGPGRAAAYLDTLLGPAGQAVAYERIGSEPFGDTILDAYRLSYEGISQPAVIYVDEYVFETLYAPVGFTCSIAFPLAAP